MTGSIVHSGCGSTCFAVLAARPTAHTYKSPLLARSQVWNFSLHSSTYNATSPSDQSAAQWLLLRHQSKTHRHKTNLKPVRSHVLVIAESAVSQYGQTVSGSWSATGTATGNPFALPDTRDGKLSKDSTTTSPTRKFPTVGSSSTTSGCLNCKLSERRFLLETTVLIQSS